MSGSIDSIRSAEIVGKRLKEFGLDLNQLVVSCTTDGTSMMVKFKREIESFHQQCVVHTIHLAVCGESCLKKSVVVVEDADKQTDNTEELVHKEEDFDSSNSFFNFKNNGENESTTELHENLRSLIEKVKKYAVFFLSLL